MRTVYEVRNTAGELIAEHVRIPLAEGKKAMAWRLPGGKTSDGLCGLGVAALPLYGSENIRTYETGQFVIVTEGEKACEALWSLGIDALGTVTGAGSTPGEDALSALLAFDVVLWPDHDAAGDLHMQRVAAGLMRLGRNRPRRLIWGYQKGDDAADFVEQGGDRVTADLLIAGADPWILTAPPTPTVVRPSYDRTEGDWRVQTARAKLADVAQDRLGPPTRRQGRSLFWHCPFHGGDREPSFKVDLKEPFFRCFGCPARGDVFDLLERLDGAGFRDVLRELAPERLLGAAIPW